MNAVVGTCGTSSWREGKLTTPIGNPGSGGNYTVADPNSLFPASLETLSYSEVMY